MHLPLIAGGLMFSSLNVWFYELDPSVARHDLTVLRGSMNIHYHRCATVLVHRWDFVSAELQAEKDA